MSDCSLYQLKLFQLLLNIRIILCKVNFSITYRGPKTCIKEKIGNGIELVTRLPENFKSANNYYSKPQKLHTAKILRVLPFTAFNTNKYLNLS